jgi:RIO-like serine/threonine protein kinase
MSEKEQQNEIVRESQNEIVQEPQFVELVDGKLLDKTTGILRITRAHRNFETITDSFQPVMKASDHVLQILRKNAIFCTNVMKILDYNDEFVYVEWIDGIPLINLSPRDSWMHQTSDSLNFTKITKAVKWLHSIGIVHLDIRAKNILIRKDGEPVIIDLMGALPIDEEKRNRDYKDLRRLEEELLSTWYERITY